MLSAEDMHDLEEAVGHYLYLSGFCVAHKRLTLSKDMLARNFLGLDLSTEGCDEAVSDMLNTLVGETDGRL